MLVRVRTRLVDTRGSIHLTERTNLNDWENLRQLESGENVTTLFAGRIGNDARKIKIITLIIISMIN